MSSLKISPKSTVKNRIQLLAHLSQVMLVNRPLTSHPVRRYEILTRKRVIKLGHLREAAVKLLWGQLD